MSSRSASKIKITGFDELFGQDIREENKVVEISISELKEFSGHPFLIENLEELVESIKEYGVLVPGLARESKEGGYELISGHRRKRACELAGKDKMPVIIKNLIDDEATIAMVDANIQRDNLKYSEKAFAYKMKFDAIKHQGSKGDKFTADIIGEKINESGRQVQRYIRLTKLHPDLLNMVDEELIPFIPAVNISYLGAVQQNWLLNAMYKTKRYPSNKQAMIMKQYYDEGSLDQNMIVSILTEKKEKDIKVTISYQNFMKYFNDDYTKKEIEAIIIELLEKWKQDNIGGGLT